MLCRRDVNIHLLCRAKFKLLLREYPMRAKDRFQGVRAKRGTESKGKRMGIKKVACTTAVFSFPLKHCIPIAD